VRAAALSVCRRVRSRAAAARQANPGARPEYAAAAEALAKEMARVRRADGRHVTAR
jgi:uncharacterized heparinase superfamily protein